jgi:hypothetical protein
MSDQYFEHQELIKKTKILACQVWPQNIRLFDRHVGLFYKKRINKGILNYSPIQINRKGMADVWGVFTHKGIPIHLELEFKTGNATLNADQLIWKQFCHDMNWLWFEVRNEQFFIKELEWRILGLGF